VTCLYDVLKADINDKTKLALLTDFDRVLGLDLADAASRAAEPAKEQADGDLAAWVEDLLAQRAEAKKSKNWAEADRIRDELAAKGVTVTDTPDGPKWSLA
ncbi:MAG: cysteine--tRNA ligase, partial [Clostridia bacterium]|nr:cysteine--tRNA ligase [Clostridia bacterium]